ncbi:MAG TPA: HNH endonuclease [Mycobacterium sp.]|jgi:hypothetical protein|uniref:HNH endonuclease n=1 Tax=Mycobacterium sp. TaxID=1785 RepID=UPI002F40A15A
MTASRGTTNRNDRGSSADRLARRIWLIETFRADCDVVVDTDGYVNSVWINDGVPACRCYRCGRLLTADTVTVDRIIPGCLGGTYRRNNIRPACGLCNSVTGAVLARRTKVEASA